MACYSPLSGWESTKLNPTGKRSIVFNPRQGFSDRPVDVPCGKCHGCRADQSLMWSIRAYHESTLHLRNCFVTLTYNDKNLPSDGLIVKKDLQDFFKRLRKDGPTHTEIRNGKKVKVSDIRYIACGEYGDQFRRPHYHAIIFGENFYAGKIQLDENLYTNPVLERIWGKGNVSIAEVTMASICYVCGYVFKKISDTDTFNLSSRRPPIGANWLERFKSDLVRTGHVVIEGRKYPVPTRYLEWSPEDFAILRKDRKTLAQANKKDGTQLRHMEKNHKQKTNQKKGKL